MKSAKALRATTIIPDTLYVDREADRQLEGVIDEMGRPAYILVARQMGKTNLLLRMKREREANGDLALYMDLSTPFDTARDLFRAIVDNLAEALGEPECLNKIKADRVGDAIDANAEFDRHLRLLLAEDQHERVIIILDEIDSLVGHAYSDRILSQIRSMYFARANYPVYEKLTYVLSGVAEPTDLIKDRNVSPFNIGEKIYLNDFTLAETSLLLSKAGLRFGPEIIEAVHDWANGNPRMTWDICSALEDLERSGEALTPQSVNSVIQKLYLTRFDRAPLDHVRALAETDPEVRDALIALLYGRGEALDDRARSKLYLAGITTASANDAPKIKNRIIEFALSEAWLSQVEAGKKGLLEAASKRHDEQDYLAAVSLFEEFIEAEGSDASLADLHLFKLGMSYFTLSRLDDAERAFQAAVDRSRSPAFRHLLRFHLGNTLMLSGNPAAALEHFEEVERHEGEHKLRAAQNVATALAAISLKDNAERIIDIGKAVIASLGTEADLTDEDLAELTIAAHYQMARAHRVLENSEEATIEVRAGIEAALPHQLPSISFLSISEEIGDAEKKALLKSAAAHVIAERMPYSSSPAMLAFKVDDMALLVGLALKFEEVELFDGLLDVATDGQHSERFNVLLKLAGAFSSPAFSPLAAKIYSHALQKESGAHDAAPELRLEAARGWFGRAEGKERDIAAPVFYELVFDAANEEHVTMDDGIILTNRLGRLIQSGEYEEAGRIIEYAKARASFWQDQSSLLYALFLVHELSLNKNMFNQPAVKRLARRINSLLIPQRLREDNLALVYPAIVDQLRNRAADELRPAELPPAAKSYGRNDLVTVRDRLTGIESRMKYKKAEAGIRSGTLEIIGA